MSDDETLVDAAKEHTGSIDPARVDAVWKRIQTSRQQPRGSTWTTPAKAAAALALALAIAGPVWALRHDDDAPLRLASGAEIPSLIRTDSESRDLQLSDGSEIHLGPESELRVLFNERQRLELLHRNGEVELTVAETGRLWRLDAGLAAVEVMHAGLRVERTGELRISVVEGQALVRSVLLEDGVELLRGSHALALPAGVRLDDAPMTHHAAPQTAGTTHLSLETSVPSRALLLRAERLRRGGEHPRAIGLLHTIVERNDEESALAAFTLGRIHQSHRPELAAHDFALAIQLGLEEPLRRAAHRRWIESLAATGADTREAEDVMLRAYPDEPLLQLEGEDE